MGEANKQIKRIDEDMQALRDALRGTQDAVQDMGSEVAKLRLPAEKVQIVNALGLAKFNLAVALGQVAAQFHTQNPALRLKTAAFYELGGSVVASVDIVVR